MKRPELSDLHDQLYDVLIIGAGINGCAAAQQLSARGYRVLIIDKSDFAAGASSKSSRLLHCGLRHLAPGNSLWDFLRQPHTLVTALINARASMAARDDIASTLPELTRPVYFCFPIYKDDAYAPWMIDSAFALLKMFRPSSLPLDYRRYKPTKAAAVPYAGLLRDQPNLRSLAVFREYLFDWPERIAIDTLIDAASLGADVRNYTRFAGLEGRDDKGWAVTLQDMAGNQPTCQIRARTILNVAGAWSDEVARDLSPETDFTQKVLKLKGAQLVVQLPEELSDWGMMAINRAKEPLYCVPLRGRHIVGLNREPTTEPADSPVARKDEVDWLLAELNFLMPSLDLTRKDICMTMGGLQPITHDPREAHGSRAIKVHDLAKEGFPNVMTLTGGPIMTHRQVGRDLADSVSARISPSCKAKAASYTASPATLALNGLRGPEGTTHLSPELIQQLAHEEQCCHLEDLMFRRAGLAWNPDQGQAELAQVAQEAGKTLGWSESRLKEEESAYRKLLEREFSGHLQ
ncbi:FAD-dependent oxidoreductase [Rhodovibrionaceae bacterium A322]